MSSVGAANGNRQQRDQAGGRQDGRSFRTSTARLPTFCGSRRSIRRKSATMTCSSAYRQPASTSVTGTSWLACRTCCVWWASDSERQSPCTRHGCRRRRRGGRSERDAVSSGRRGVRHLQRLVRRVRLGAPRAAARMPASSRFEQAAAVPTSAVAALQALRDAGGITRASRSCSSGRREASGCSRCRSPNRSAPR